MAKLVVTMTMSIDGFFAGPGGELDWITQAPDPEFSRDNVASFERFDRGFIGYPTASGMLPFWHSVAGDQQAPDEVRTLARALNRLRPVLISSRPEAVPWPNAELLVVRGDEELVSAVRKEKEKPGKDLGVPGGIRTVRTLTRLGLVDEYVFTVHPVTLGSGQRVFTGKTSMELVGAKTYPSGLVRAAYRPVAALSPRPARPASSSPRQVAGPTGPGP
jgi:dihydrofolate reductase